MEPKQPAEVSYEGGSTQITLRNPGCARIGNAVFLLVWLAVWAYGEMLSLKALLGFLGYEVDLPFPLPVDNLKPKETVIVFLAIWLAFWTWAGVAAMLQFLRALFGRDVIELAPGEWRVTRHIGPLGTTRTFATSDGWTPILRSSAQSLAARRGAKYVIVSRLGTIAERTWARDEIARQYPQTQASSAAPAGYTSRAGETGGLVVTPITSRRGTLGCLAVVLLWNVPLAWWLAVESKAYIPIWAIAIGVVLAALAFWVVFVRESWLVAPNMLERRLRIFGFTRTTRISDATLRIEQGRDSDGDHFYRLSAVSLGGRPMRIKSSINDPEPTAEFAVFVARETGWKLETSEG